MKVYVVEDGEYEMRGISAIFSSEATARRFVERLNRDSVVKDADVEEWELDATHPVWEFDPIPPKIGGAE